MGSENYYGRGPATKQFSANDILPAVIDKTKLTVGLAENVTTVSSTQALTLAMTGTLLINAAAGAVAVTLPAASAGSPLVYRIIRVDTVFTNLVTVLRAGSDTINLLYTSIAIGVENNTVVLESDGTSNWELSGALKTPTTGRKNALINGAFGHWQRGTTFSGITTGVYTADRWIASGGTGGSPALSVSQATNSPGNANIPGEPKFAMTFNQTAQATATGPTLEQRIDGVRSFANKTVTLSFYASVGSSTQTVTPSLTQNFGSGGSPSVSVTLAGSALTLTTTPKLFVQQFTLASLSTKTIGTSNDYLSLLFTFPTSVTFTATITHVQLEEGSVATQFERRTRTEESLMCQRYYTKTFPDSTTPAQSGGVAGGVNWVTQSAGIWQVDWQYPTTMRAAPSITTYNPSAANANWRDVTGTADVTVTVGDTSDRKVTLQGAGTTAAHVCVIHVAANAEL